MLLCLYFAPQLQKCTQFFYCYFTYTNLCGVFNSILYFLFYFFADPILIQRFIHSVYGNLDKVKKLIEISFTMRNNYPNVFLKRDPLSPETKQVFEIT